MEEISVASSSSANGSSSSNNNNNSFENVEVITHLVEESRGRDGHLKRRIEKVPLILRNDKRNEGWYDPKVVSVGPYHHGNPKLQIAENIKPKVAQLFVETCSLDMDKFRQKVQEEVDIARSYYVDGSTVKYSDNEFINMMLLDACFVLAHIEAIAHIEATVYRNRTMVDESIACLGMQAQSDLVTDIFYLLENQLPFLVLRTVMALKYGHDALMTALDRFCGMLSFGVEDQNSKAKASDICKEQQPLHLLEFFWLRERGFNQPNKKTRKPPTTSAEYSINKFIYSFRSVTELKDKGIHVRPSTFGSSKAIEFKSCCLFGLLKLPPFFFTPEWIIRCSNLIAYELCLNDPKNLPTMAYVHFMKSIINCPDDVKELRYKAILFTTFSNDQEVVENLKSIITFGGEDFNIYEEVEEKIQKYYHSKPKAWIADLVANYCHFCSSPWTFIAFLAATSLLVLAFLQTYFTIYPQ